MNPNTCYGHSICFDIPIIKLEWLIVVELKMQNISIYHPLFLQLNKFNHRGDMLASTMGLNILLWARKEFLAEKQEALMTSIKNSGIKPNSGSSQGQVRRGGGGGGGRSEGKKKPSRDSQTKQDKKTAQAKLQTKTQSKPKERKR